jgi:hypothetical protein
MNDVSLHGNAAFADIDSFPSFRIGPLLECLSAAACGAAEWDLLKMTGAELSRSTVTLSEDTGAVQFTAPTTLTVPVL